MAAVPTFLCISHYQIRSKWDSAQSIITKRDIFCTFKHANNVEEVLNNSTKHGGIILYYGRNIASTTIPLQFTDYYANHHLKKI